MGTGILFLVITGIMWVGVGGVISSAAKKQLNLALIQGGGALLIVLAGVPVMIWGSNSIHPLPLIALPVAGILNYIVFYFMEKAMAKGPNGLIWAMVQSAFLMPFLMGVIFFDVPCPAIRWIAVATLLISMLLMGLFGKSSEGGNTSGKKSFTWLLWTAAAYLTAGSCQCCFNLSSYFVKDVSTDIPGLLFRSALNASGGVFIFLMLASFDRKKFEYKGCIPGIFTFGICNLIAIISLFIGLDKVAAAGAGAIGYPIAMGTTISAFLVYTAFRLKERLSLPALAGVLLCLAGIVMISL